MRVTDELIRRLIGKEAKRAKYLGVFDYSRGSYDWRAAEDRAYRIAKRVNRR